MWIQTAFATTWTIVGAFDGCGVCNGKAQFSIVDVLASLRAIAIATRQRAGRMRHLQWSWSSV